jgi:RHS repeat-associated protein
MKNLFSVGLLVSVAVLQPANAQTSFGRTPGHFGVSQVGSAQYSIPIWAPPGPRGIQPNLALQYDSGSGIGPLGIGFSLTGLGQISRCNLTTAQDTTPAPVALVTSDGYCINGNRLRLTSGAGTYGAAGSTYQTEIADFSNITANGVTGNGPASFTVQGRDGNTYQYGFTDTNGNGANSQVLASGTTTALTWLLSKVTDRAGNNLVINYTALTGTAVPHTILWTPTSAGASTYVYEMLFNYVPNTAQSSIYEIVDATPVNNTDLLSSIEILSGGTVIKDYFLGYQASTITGREELISVKECADSAASNCLIPTNIIYPTSGPGVSTASTAVPSSAGLVAARYDFNGDGIPDLIYNNGTNWLVAFGSASGYAAPVNTGIAVGPGPALFGNLTAGHEDGILKVVGTTWEYYLWNGSGFVGASTGLTYDSTSKNYVLADINGDGLPDLISQKDTTITFGGHTSLTSVISSRLNTSSPTAASFSATLSTAFTKSGILSVFLQGPDAQNGKLRRYDFNGDGRDDLVVQVESTTLTLDTYELVSTGTGFSASAPISSVPASTSAIPVFFTNWNDDACTDFVTSNVLYISACNGTAPQHYALPGTILLGMDWDGDGRTDILVQNGGFIGVYLSPGNSTAVAPSITATSVPYSASCTYIWMDVTGDGLDDLGCASTSLSYFPHNIGQDLATSFADGYGVTYSPTYVPLSASGGIYTKGSSAAPPYQDYVGPMYVVSSYTSSDGIGGTFTTSYAYAGAIMNLQGRGFEGFTTVSRTDSRNGFKDTRTYSTAFPNAGMLSAESVTQSSGLNVSVGTYNLTSSSLDSTLNNERVFPYTFSYSLNTYEVQVGGSYNGQLITTATMSRAAPDIYGNFASVAKSVTDEDSGSPYFGQSWTTTTTRTITANPSTWCNSLPTESDVTKTAPGVPAITRHLSFTPDYSFCRDTQQVAESGNLTYQVTTGLSYDSFGNLSGQTVTGVGMAARTSSVNWGTTGQLPTTSTNALSQITHTNFDANSGKLLSVQDPNGISISWLYDPFQRKEQETRPDGTTTTWAYNSCAAAGCVNSNNKSTVVQTNINVGGTTLNTQNTYLDAFDRTLVTSKQMLNGAFDRNEIQYDNMGNVHQQVAPCTFVSCVAYLTTNTYDSLNRLLTSQRPISATNSALQTTTMQYAGRTRTVTDPQGKVTTTIIKVSGKVGRTKDSNGYFVNFNQDAFGSLLSVTDSLSNTLRTMTYAYGLKAFRTSLTDMDLGSRSYTPDALGELIVYSDGKDQHFSATYDALSRMTTRTEPDLATTWTWGATATSFNIGKLASVSSVSTTSGTHTDSYTFDSKGRLSNHTVTNPTDGARAFDYAYDATTGLLSTLTYPTSPTFRLEAGYTYQNGIMKSIFKVGTPSTIWWQANSTNPRGQITQEATQDASTDPEIVSSRTYDAVTGWLGSIQSGVSGGSTLQNEAYLHDEMGNVTQRQNNNLGLTENFFYDNLYRLDHSTLGGATNLQMAYDAMGDITSKSDVAAGATWTYDPVRKHAVTQAGSASLSYAYDANGNVTSRNGSIIGWTSYNYPNGVTTATESATFDYGPDRQRWRMVYTGPTGTETTYYATPMFEAVYTSSGTDFRHYIFAPDGRAVMQLSRSTSGSLQRSLLTDHQGSISSMVSDATGASFVSESYTAFGNRREASTWTGTPTSGELASMNAITRQGYTFQTVLGSMGLNHMNGRIEDSITGRFLSPDPHGTMQGNTQSWNRYSYVLNNPLTFTDPTGFCGTNDDDAELGDCPDIGGDDGGGGGGGGGDGGGADTAFTTKGGLQEITVTATRCDADPYCSKITAPDNWTQTPAPAPQVGLPTPSSQVGPPTPPPKKPPPPPPPCNASRANNPNQNRNIGTGVLLGGLGVGTFAAVNIVGFPEIEFAEGIGVLLGGISSFGDAGLILLNYGVYGGIAGGTAGSVLTSPQCKGG